MKRQRGRNRNNNNRNNSNRQIESNGPDGKVRGSATQIHEKYVNLARDAAVAGSRVKAENFRQHAEHYLRLMNAQEAAKQAAEAAREAQRQNSGDENSDEDDSHHRRRNTRNRRQRDDQDVAQNAEKSDTTSDDKSGLEVVTPKADKPKRTKKVKSEDADAVAITEANDGAEEKPSRRRRAPSRKPAEPTEAVDAAE